MFQFEIKETHYVERFKKYFNARLNISKMYEILHTDHPEIRIKLSSTFTTHSLKKISIFHLDDHKLTFVAV